MFKIFDAEQGTQLRSLVNLLTLGITAFGLKLHPDQIALIQAILITALAIFVQSPLGSASPGTTEGSTVVVPAAVTVAAPVPENPPVVDNGVGYVAPVSGDTDLGTL